MTDPTAPDATQLRQIRLLIADTADVQLLTDPQLTDLFLLEQNVKRAAAAALDLIASSEALVSKAITTQDLSTDGAKVAAALRAHATALRQQVIDDDANGDDDGSGFGVVQTVRPVRVPELSEQPFWWC